MVFVDGAGVKEFRVTWCNCANRLSKMEQILRMGLFPGTLRSTSTIFTIPLLDYFYLDNMECHTSAMKFYTKLRRLTDNVDPDSVPVGYHCVLELFLPLLNTVKYC